MAGTTVNWSDDSERNHEILFRFEKDFHEGKNPQLNDYLQGEGDSRHRLLVELLHSNLELRIRAGQSLRVLDYLQGHPELAQHPHELASLLKTEIRCLRQMGIQPSLQKYQADYQSILGKQVEQLFVEENRATREARIGSMIAGKYKLLAVLGEGGMGSVYAAEQTQPVRRNVAVKLIKPGMDSSGVLARFQAERQALAMMDHPNIAKMLDGGITDDGQPYFVMEHVKGLPITKFCDQEKMPLDDRLKLFMEVCHGVQHAHQKGIIHRDLKPSNILVTLTDGKAIPKVIDFGVAKALHQKLTDRTMYTEAGRMVGTLEYMAPEQADLNNLDVDTRADVYALGVVLYELLTGQVPFTGKELRHAAYDEMLRIIREMDPPKPSIKLSSSVDLPKVAALRQVEPKLLSSVVAGELDWIVMKCLEKERGRRYESAAALSRELHRFLKAEPIEAKPPSIHYRLNKWVRRNKITVLALGAVTISIIIGMIGLYWGLIESQTAWHAESVERGKADARAKEAALSEEKAKKETERAIQQADRADKQAAEVEKLLNQQRLEAGLSAGKNHNYLEAVRLFSTIPANTLKNKMEFQTHRDRIRAFWNWGNRPTLLNVLRHEGDNEITSFAFSPKGHKMITSGDNGSIREWNINDGRMDELIHTPITDNKWYSADKGIYSHDGSLIVSMASNDSVCIWRRGPNGTDRNDIIPPSILPQINDISLNETNELVAVACNNSAYVWSVDTSSKSIGPIRHDSQVDNAFFSKKGTTLVTITGRVFNHVRFRTRVRQIIDDNNHDVVTPIALHSTSNSCDDQLLMAQDPLSCVTAYSVKSGDKLWQHVFHSLIDKMDASRADDEIVLSTTDGSIIHLHGDTMSVLRQPHDQLARDNRCVFVGFAKNEKMIIGIDKTGNVSCWDGKQDKHLVDFKLPGSDVKIASMSPDGLTIVSLHNDDRVYVTRMHDRTQTYSFVEHGEIDSLAIDQSSRYLAVVSKDQVKVYDLASTINIDRFIPAGLGNRDLRNIYSDGRFCVSHGRQCRIYDIDTDSLFVNRAFEASQQVAICGDGSRCLFYGANKDLLLYTKSSDNTEILPFLDGRGIASASFTDDYRIVALSRYTNSPYIFSYNDTQKSWQVNEVRIPRTASQKVNIIFCLHSDQIVYDLHNGEWRGTTHHIGKIDNQGNIVPAGISDNSERYQAIVYTPNCNFCVGVLVGLTHHEERHPLVHVIDNLTGRKRSLRIHDYRISSPSQPDIREADVFAVSPNGNFLGVIGNNSQVTIWNVDSGLLHATLSFNEDEQHKLIFSHDNRYLMLHNASSFCIWEVLTGQAVSPKVSLAKSERVIGFSRGGDVISVDLQTNNFCLRTCNISFPISDDVQEVLSCYSGTARQANGLLLTLKGDSLARKFHKMKGQYPNLFSVPYSTSVLWRSREIATALVVGDLAAANSHVNWLIAEAVLSKPTHKK